MAHILAVSFASQTSAEDRRVYEHRANSALAPYLGLAAAVGHSTHADSVFMIHDPSCHAASIERDGKIVLGTAPPVVAGSRASLPLLYHQLLSEHSRRVHLSMAAPFSLILLDGHEIHGVVDHAGLQHLYWCQDGTCAAVSTSSVVLARYFGKKPSASAFWGLSRVGNFLARDSLYEDVWKIAGGERVVLSEGGAHCQTEPVSTPDHLEFVDRDEALQQGARILSNIVDDFLDAEPDAGVELSGGLDSRLILSAIGKERLVGREALTLGNPSDADIIVAGGIANKYGMRQRVVSLEDLGDLGTKERLVLLREAAASCDYGANVFARAVLTWVNSVVDDRPRFSGQNGEFIRGFYYPGQVESEQYGASKISGLVRWRIFTNQSIDLRIMKESYRVEFEDQLHRQIEDAFSPDLGSWLRATDEFYLSPRMERWVGAGYSAESTSRKILAPFFVPSFLDWGRRLQPSWKKRDGVSSSLVSILSPELASIPLAGGSTPSAIAAGGFGMRIRAGQQFAEKAIRNLAQRFRSGTRAPVGAAGLCQMLIDDVKIVDHLSRVADLEWIDQRGLDQVLDQADSGLWTTLGYLLALEWGLEALGE